MKKTDIALIVIIVSVSAGLSYWIANSTIGKSNDQPIIVRTVDEIKTDGDALVDERVFSKDAVNPTVEVSISGEDLTSFIEGDDALTGNEENSESVLPSEDGESVLPEGTVDSPVGE